MRKRTVAATLIAATVLAAGCASGGKKDPGLGVRTLDCVVIEREETTAGSSGTSRGYSSTGDYYMVFETKEGEATSRYRLQVTRTQWFRFPEGSRVRITLNNNILTDIRSIE
jgi:hypothetical protein